MTWVIGSSSVHPTGPRPGHRWIRIALVAVLVSLLGSPGAAPGAARISDDGTTLFLQDEVRAPGTPRPGVAINLEPSTGSRQIWVSGDGLPTLPTLDVICGRGKRTLPLTRAQTARELHVGLYAVPRDLAEVMLNSTDCRIVATGPPIPVPRELLWTVWADTAKGKTAPRILEAEVAWVIDGDTVRVKIGDETETVRYIGINAPEVSNPPQPWEYAGREARDVNALLVARKKVRLELDAHDRDPYGRLLAYVYVGDMLVNAEMIRRGYANAVTEPPNVKHEALFSRLEREARQAKQGLWLAKPPEAPAAPAAAAAPATAAPAAAPAAPAPAAAATPATPAGQPAAAAPAASPAPAPPAPAKSLFECPSSHPIKGNLNARGECVFFLNKRSGAGKKAELCFATEGEARSNGCSPAP